MEPTNEESVPECLPRSNSFSTDAFLSSIHDLPRPLMTLPEIHRRYSQSTPPPSVHSIEDMRPLTLPFRDLDPSSADRTPSPMIPTPTNGRHRDITIQLNIAAVTMPKHLEQSASFALLSSQDPGASADSTAPWSSGEWDRIDIALNGGSGDAALQDAIKVVQSVGGKDQFICLMRAIYGS